MSSCRIFSVLCIQFLFVLPALANDPPNNNFTDVDLRFATPCDTPNRDAGLCVEIYKCQTILDGIRNNNGRWYQFVNDSRCGPRNENPQQPRVCCGQFSNYRTVGDVASSLPQPIDPFPSSCGRQNTTLETRIVGGTEAELGEFPWIVRLRHTNDYGYKSYGCAGFLIHEKYVLTAAHCVTSRKLEEVLGLVEAVLLGEHDSSKEIDCTNDGKICADPTQIVKVRRIIVHPSYNRSSRDHHHDIALIHLRKKVKFNNFVQPICLPKTVNNDGDNEVWVSGWGVTENDDSSIIKRKVGLQPFDHADCAEKYKNVHINVTMTQTCAGGISGKDSCSGDSGGPLMRRKANGIWYAEGLVSFGVGCGRTGWPGVYSYIPMYYDWIRKLINKRESNDVDKVTNRSPVVNSRTRFLKL